MNTAKKQDPTPQSYSPNVKPMLLTKSEELAENKKYEVYEDMPCRIDFIELPETLKLVGVAKTHDWSFSNIEDYHKNYTDLVEDKSLP